MKSTLASKFRRALAFCLTAACLIFVLFHRSLISSENAPHAVANTDVGRFVKQHCSECHNDKERSGGFSFDSHLKTSLTSETEVWEKAVRRLRARQMPPQEAERPTEEEYESAISIVEKELDVRYAADPRPGRTDTLRRLTRTEYRNAIRDLLALDIDVEALLPPDESSHGFDNITVGELSPTLLSRYVSASQKISRLAIGGANKTMVGDTIRIRPDITQEEHVEGLPVGTRGGALIDYTFPVDGEYEIQARLARDRNEEVEGLNESHDVEFLLDRERIKVLKVAPPPGRKGYEFVDTHLKVRVRATAGAHQLGVTFIKKPSSLMETKRQPYQAHYNMHRHPRISPAVYEVSITGPYGSAISTGPGGAETTGSGGDLEFAARKVATTLSRRKIFVCLPNGRGDEEECAQRNLASLLRLAFRRPVLAEDRVIPMAFYRKAIAEGSNFETGIEIALSSILINPHFLFRVESDPIGIAANTVYPISDLEFASRLSFFLWSSLPDQELLELAEAGTLRRDDVLEQQVRRLLKDPRSRSLIENFASQWLYLRNLDSLTPDLRLFPDFDDNLRQAFRKETEMFFESVLREDRSSLDLLKADYTFLNERLAKHYGIPHVYGTRFRRVDLDAESHRGGLLRHGSILTVTSYATRTSPVIRGHWILKNILGLAPPPPPANIPALKDNTIAAELSVRQRLAEHRANAACASCHNLMDPVGFALENFDAIGRWREVEAGQPVDVSGGLPDGSQFVGVAGLEQGLLGRPELFVSTLVEKLLTFAIGRGIEYDDAPAIRSIVRNAKTDNYQLSSLFLEIAKSPPMQMRTSP